MRQITAELLKALKSRTTSYRFYRGIAKKVISMAATISRGVAKKHSIGSSDQTAVTV